MVPRRAGTDTCEGIGLASDQIRLRDSRHTAATLLLKAGVPAHVVSQRLGHSSVAVTLQQYGHVLPGQQQEAASKLAAMVDDVG